LRFCAKVLRLRFQNIQTKRNMILTIARKELTETLRDGRFRWSAGIVLVLLLASLFTSWRYVSTEINERELAKQGERKRWLNQDEKNPHSAAHYGNYAFKPKHLLSTLDDGTDAYTGVAVLLEAHHQNQFEYRKAADATPVQRFGDLIAAVTMQLLIPLLIILTAFSAFTREREQGTLKLLMSLGVPMHQLAFGKLLGVFGALLLILIPATLIGSLVLMQSANLSFEPVRYGAMIGAYLAFFAVWCALALVVSAKATSSQVSLVILLGIWFAQSFLAPKLFIDLAEQRYPLPSRRTFNQQVRNDIRGGIDGHNPADKRRKELEARLLKEYGVDSVQKLPVNFDAIAMQEGEEYTSKVFDKHFGNLYRRYDEQSRFYQWAGVLSPTISIQMLSMAIAGSDFWHHRHFATAAEQYRRILVKELNMDMAHNSKTGDWEYKAGRALWEKIPAFEYTSPSLTWAIENVVQSLWILAVWLVASLVGLVVSVSKISVL
jgi:ABC-2 type transport system permease protein